MDEEEKGKCDDGGSASGRNQEEDAVITSDDSSDGEPGPVMESEESFVKLFLKLSSSAMEVEDEERKCADGVTSGNNNQETEVMTSDDSDDGLGLPKLISKGATEVTVQHHHEVENMAVNGTEGGDMEMEPSSEPILISQFQPLDKLSLRKGYLLKDVMTSGNVAQEGVMDKDKITPIDCFMGGAAIKPVTIKKPKECRTSGRDLDKVLEELRVKSKAPSSSKSSSPLVRKMVGGVPAVFTGPKLDAKCSPVVRKKINGGGVADMDASVSGIEDGMACPIQPLVKTTPLNASPISSLSPFVKKVSRREAKRILHSDKGKGPALMDVEKDFRCSIPLSLVKVKGSKKKTEEEMEARPESRIESKEEDNGGAMRGSRDADVTEKEKTFPKRLRGKKAANRRIVCRRSTRKKYPVQRVGYRVEEEVERSSSEEETGETVSHHKVMETTRNEDDTVQQPCEEEDVEEDGIPKFFPRFTMRGKSGSLRSIGREPVNEYDRVKGDRKRGRKKVLHTGMEKIDEDMEKVYPPVSIDRIKEMTKIPSLPFKAKLKREIDLKFKDAHKEPPHIDILNTSTEEIVEIACQSHDRLLEAGFIKYRIKGVREPSKDWIKEYRDYKWDGKDGFRMEGTSKLVTIGVEQVWRVGGHLFYTCTASGKEAYELLPCVRSNTLGEIADALGEILGGTTDEEKAENFWRRLYMLKVNKKRSGTGLLIPYINVYDYVDVEGSTETLGFNMNELKSPLRDAMKFKKNGEPINHSGITDSMTYFAFPMSLFCIHIEDSCYNSLNVNRCGCTKVWYIVPPSHYDKLVEKLVEHYGLLDLPKKDVIKYFNDRCRLHHKHDLITPRVLEEWNIPFKIVYQKPGDVIVLASRSAHFGMSLGISCGYAANAICSDFHWTCRNGIEQCPHNYIIPVNGTMTPELEAKAREEREENRYFILTDKFIGLRKASAEQYLRNYDKSSEEGLKKMKELEARLGIEGSDDDDEDIAPPSPELDQLPLPITSTPIPNNETPHVGNEEIMEGEIYHIHVEAEDMPVLFPELFVNKLPSHLPGVIGDNGEVPAFDNDNVMEPGKKYRLLSLLQHSAAHFPSQLSSLFSSSSFQSSAQSGSNNGELGQTSSNPENDGDHEVEEQSVGNGTTMDHEEAAPRPNTLSPMSILEQSDFDVDAWDKVQLEQPKLDVGGEDEATDREETAPNFKVPSPLPESPESEPPITPSTSPKAAVLEETCESGQPDVSGGTGEGEIDQVETIPPVSIPAPSSLLEQPQLDVVAGERALDQEELTSNYEIPSPRPKSPESEPPTTPPLSIPPPSSPLEQPKLDVGAGERVLDREEPAPNSIIPSPLPESPEVVPLMSSSPSPKSHIVVEETCESGDMGEKAMDYVETIPPVTTPVPSSPLEQPKLDVGAGERVLDREEPAPNSIIPSPLPESPELEPPKSQAIIPESTSSPVKIHPVGSSSQTESGADVTDDNDDDDDWEHTRKKCRKKATKKERKKKASKSPVPSTSSPKKCEPKSKVEKFVYDTDYWVKHARTPTAAELLQPVELDVATMTNLNRYRHDDKKYKIKDGLPRFQCPSCPKSYTTAKECKKHILKGNSHTLYGRCMRKGCTGFYNCPETLIEHMTWHWDEDLRCGVIYDEEKKTFRERVQGDLDDNGLMKRLVASVAAYDIESDSRKKKDAEEKAKKQLELEKKKLRRGKTKDFLKMLEEEAGPSKPKRAKKSKDTNEGDTTDG